VSQSAARKEETRRKKESVYEKWKKGRERKERKIEARLKWRKTLEKFS